MSKFLTSLVIEQITDKVFSLVSPLVYQSDMLGGFKIEVPAGFQSDGASVPRLPVAYMLFGDRAHHESVLHDYLYRCDSVPEVAFSTANDVFLEAMKVRGKSWFIRWSMFLGVKFFGNLSYHKRNVNASL